MKRRFWAAALAAALSAPLQEPLYAAFSDLGAGARAPGMADAFVAVADDVQAMHYNPAGLGTVERPQLSLDYLRLHLGLSDGSNLSQSNLSLAAPLGRARWGTLGASWQSFALSGMYSERTIALSYGRLAFSGPQLGSLYGGVQLKHLWRGFNAPPEAFNGLDHGVAVGRADPVLSGKKGKTAVGADLGVLWRPPGRWSAGLAVKNANQPDVGFSSADKLPASYRLGVGYKSLWLNLTGEARQERAPTGLVDRRVSLAGERLFPSLDHGTLGLRAGFGVGGRDYREAAAGVSYRINKLELDYAFAMPLGTVSQTKGSHRVGLVFHFGAPTPEEEMSAALVSQMQRLRARTEGGYEAGELSKPAPLSLPDLEEVRRHVLAGEYLLAHQKAVLLVSERPADAPLLRLARRLDIVSAAIPELLRPAERWERAASSGAAAFVAGRDREALLMVSYAASLNRELLELERLLGRMEQAIGSHAPRASHGRTLVAELLAASGGQYRAGQYDQSLALAQEALLLEPGDPRALERMGSNLYLLGYYPEAIAAWRRALQRERNPGERAVIEDYIRRAEQAQAGGRKPPEAKPAEPAAAAPPGASDEEGPPAGPAARPRAGDPREVERLFLRGMEHYARGEMLQAVGAFQRVLSLDPKNEPARKALERIRRKSPAP